MSQASLGILPHQKSMIPPSLFTTGSLANRILFELFQPHSRQNILLQILRQNSARKRSQASINTYIGESSALSSSLSCRGWLEVNLKSGETLGNTAPHLQGQPLLNKTLIIHFSLVLRSFSMISPAPYFVQEKWGLTNENKWDISFASKKDNNNST